MGFVIMMILGLGLLGLAFFTNGKAHQANDGSGGGQIMVGGFMVFLAIISIISLFTY
ncbi:MAG: hypothetical protein IKW08_01530 [Roseburia sp.]|nr:hypothetical protein [Roseburia sp.]